MKGLDDFVYVLIAAVVLITIFIVISPYISQVAPKGEVKVVESFSLGKVGFSTSVPTKNINLGSFTVGEPQRELLKKIVKMDISAGLTSSEERNVFIHIPEWLMESKRGIVIKFDLKDTNKYGNIVIIWNGKEIVNDRLSPRKYEFHIEPKYVQASNTLKVKANGPGLLFWASTIYEIEDFTVELEYGPSKLFHFTLLNKELESFKNGKIEFFARSSSNLVIKINGVEIFNKVPDGVETAEFDISKVPLTRGENIITFYSPQTIVVNGAKLYIYLFTQEVVKTRSVNVSKEDYELFKKNIARIDYKVDDVAREGILKIYVNGNIVEEARPALGWNNVTFSSDVINEGKNTIEFTATGEFSIPEVNFGIQYK
jgi:hypothetical protein